MVRADTINVCSLPLANNALHSPTSIDMHSHEPQRYNNYAHTHTLNYRRGCTQWLISIHIYLHSIAYSDFRVCLHSFAKLTVVTVNRI